MIYHVLGCGPGSMGEAIAAGLIREANSIVLIADINSANETAAREKLAKMPMGRMSGIMRANPMRSGLDILKLRNYLPRLFQSADVVISALPAFLNPLIAESVVRANETRESHKNGRTHYCDLGGVLNVTKEILGLHQRAVVCGISLLPDCGLEPGLGNIIAVDLFNYLESANSIIIYVGGLPAYPSPPFYKKLFNLEGLREIYYTPAPVLSHGESRQIMPRCRYERICSQDWGLYFGTSEKIYFEAAITGGLGALPYYLEGKVQTLQEKTLRYDGHYKWVKKIRKKEFIERLEELLKSYPVPEKDMALMVVRAEGVQKITGKKIKIERMVKVESDENFNSMQTATGFTAAVIAKLIAEGHAKPGAHPPEMALDPNLALQALKKDFAINETQTPLP